MNGVDRVLRAGAALLVVGLAAVVLLPLWTPLVMAAWTAAMLDGVTARVARLARGKRAVGATASLLLVYGLLIPIGALVVSLVKSATAFVSQLLASPEARHALELVVQGGGQDVSLERFLEIAQVHGRTAWNLGQDIAGAGAWALILVVVFSIALFQFAVSGRETWAFIVAHTPVSKATADRLGDAFISTGRGIFVSAGLTALAQALVATVAFVALGVPRAAVLGALTFVCAFVPAIGTAVVWVPVAIGLALAGQPGKAAALALIGVLGIGSIDNVLRPVLQRWGGHIELPTWLLLCAAFGGLSAFGAAGLLLGPLVLRLAKEVIVIAREEREKSESAPAAAADGPAPS